jgi:hypothetical protein
MHLFKAEISGEAGQGSLGGADVAAVLCRKSSQMAREQEPAT